MMKSEGLGGPEELNYYTIFPTLENAVPTDVLVGQAENNELGARRISLSNKHCHRKKETFGGQ